MAAQHSDFAFPAVPACAAQWAPVYLEPMHGSGERLTAAVVAVSETGAFRLVPTLPFKALRCMYGERADALSGLTSLVVTSLEDHLAMGDPLESWRSPVSGMELGSVRWGLGEDIADVAQQAAQLVASLRSPEAGVDEADVDSAGAVESDRWVSLIKKAVVQRAQRLAPYFSREVVARSGAQPTKIAYSGERIAANFDVLMPSSLTTRRYRAKSKLIDLQIVRDHDLLARESYELLLWTPAKGTNVPWPQEQLEKVAAAAAELEEFGDKHELRVIRTTAPEEAAERIVRAEHATAG